MRRGTLITSELFVQDIRTSTHLLFHLRNPISQWNARVLGILRLARTTGASPGTDPIREVEDVYPLATVDRSPTPALFYRGEREFCSATLFETTTFQLEVR